MRRVVWLLLACVSALPAAENTVILGARRNIVVVQQDSTPPSAPGSFATSLSGDDVVATWTASSDAESGIGSYNVYRRLGAGSYSLLANTAALTYTDTSGTPTSTYTYKARAVNGAGLESSDSGTDSETIPGSDTADVTGPNTPNAPTIVSEVTSGAVVTVTVTTDPVDDQVVGGAITSGTKEYALELDGSQIGQRVAHSAAGAASAKAVGTGTGSANDAAGTVTVASPSTPMWGTSDSFYAWSRAASGDATVQFSLSSVTPAGGAIYPKGGIFLRGGTDASAASVAIAFFSAGVGGECTRRATIGATTEQVATLSFTLPIDMRIVKTGSNIVISTSPVGAGTWTVRCSTTVSLPSSFESGVFAVGSESWDVGGVNTTTVVGTGLTITGQTPVTLVGPVPTEITGNLRVRAYDNAGNSSVSSSTAIDTTSPPVSGATRIVQANGAGGAYTTIAAGIAAAVSGDVIEIRANSVGGSQTFNEPINFQNKQYDAKVTIRGRSGDTITVNNASQSLSYLQYGASQFNNGRIGLMIHNSRNILVENITIGSRAEWNESNPFSRTHARSVQIQGASHDFELKDLTFTGGSEWIGNAITRDCYNFRITGGSVAYHGTTQDEAGNAGAENGEMILVNGHHFVVDGFTAHHGAHDGFALLGYYAVVRNSSFSGDAADVQSDPQAGYRSLNIYSGVQINSIGPQSSTAGPILFENNLIRGAGQNGQQRKAMAHKLVALNAIARGNTYSDNINYAVQFPDSTGLSSCSNLPSANNRYYHNTIADTGGFVYSERAWDSCPVSTSTSYNSGHKFANNIADVKNNPEGKNTFSFDFAGTSGSYPTLWRNMEIFGNVFDGNPSNFNIQAWHGSLGGASSASVGISNGNLNHAKGSGSLAYPNNIYDNQVSTVTFSGGSSPSTRGGFSVSSWGSSASAGDARALTNATATSSGTTVTVADAYWFYDGWSIPGETGDTICIGASAGAAASNCRTITAVNTSNGQITVSSSMSVTNGHGVWLGNGGIWDNRGAIQ